MNQEYFKHAELALAAYANLNAGTPNIFELEKVKFSESQATAFSGAYQVVDRYSDATGLSATVFRQADDPDNTQSFLAIRGTEISDPADLITGLINIVSLGSTDLHLQYIKLKAKVVEWLGNGTLSSGNFKTVTY